MPSPPKSLMLLCILSKTPFQETSPKGGEMSPRLTSCRVMVGDPTGFFLAGGEGELCYCTVLIHLEEHLPVPESPCSHHLWAQRWLWPSPARRGAWGAIPAASCRGEPCPSCTSSLLQHFGSPVFEMGNGATFSFFLLQDIPNI